MRIWLIGALLVTGACASKGDLESMHFEMRAIAARQDSILMEQNRLIQALTADVGSTEGRLRQQSGEIFDLRGGISGELREHSEALARLESLVGENQRGIAAMRQELSELARTMRESSAAEAATAVGDGASTPSSPPTSALSTGDPAETYQAGVELMREGSFATAQLALQEFLGAAPNHALAPDAAFHLAHMAHETGDSEGALEAFRELRSRFPNAARAPDALYRMALIQLEMGDREGGVANLELIVNTYAGSVIAEVAADKLAEIGEGSH